MCGIAGYLHSSVEVGSSRIHSMTGAIRNRGPDDGGYLFADLETGTASTFSSDHSPEKIRLEWPVLGGAQKVQPHHLAMGHVRYSIIDPSPSGHQPMWSQCGNVCLTFNGEIYNYVELREELTGLGHEFHTSSDSEVLLHSYLAWGDCCFRRFNGFFAVAIYDARHRAVLLGRDRLGKAHMYLVNNLGRSTTWASEIKSLLTGGVADAKDIDVSAVTDFLLHGRRDRGGTFWNQVTDFPPGHFAWLDRTCRTEYVRYWTFPDRRRTTKEISIAEAAEGLGDLLSDALNLRLRADVPVAFELSGGLDSSALVGIAAARLRQHLRAYTIAFDEPHANEEPYARAVAEQYSQQIDFRVIRPGGDDFWSEANEFVWNQEEPFHSPNLHTNQRMRRQIKADGAYVIITGAAGDEMLAGYPTDYQGPFLRHLLASGKVLPFFREMFANTEIAPAQAMKGLLLDVFMSEEQRALGGKRRSGEESLLEAVASPGVLGVPLRKPSGRAELSFHARTLANMQHRLMNYWLRSGAKSDYGIPIESRAPFLDYRVVEYCLQMPPEYLIHGGWHKYVLRKAVGAYLPNDVAWRRSKFGFPFPIREWLVASNSIVAKNIVGLDCPYVSVDAVLKHYQDLVVVAPLTLWRMISLLLWWRRVILRCDLYTSH